MGSEHGKFQPQKKKRRLITAELCSPVNYKIEKDISKTWEKIRILYSTND